ncbi:hypothetical protein H0X06_05710 [Candidatus Dependentiae bacterium]|nr:hypothetical protein [Candidatus Dependentiae bacterium]
MIKSIAGILLCLSAIGGSLYAENTLEDTLVAAIKECDEKKVQLLLTDATLLDKESSGRLLDAADQSIKRRKKSISVWKSRRDLLALGGGTGAAYLAGMSFLVGVISQFYSNEVVTWYYKEGTTALPADKIKVLAPSFIGMGLVSSALAYYFLERGLRCRSAVNFHEKALEIKKLIEKVSHFNVTP